MTDPGNLHTTTMGACDDIASLVTCDIIIIVFISLCAVIGAVLVVLCIIVATLYVNDKRKQPDDRDKRMTQEADVDARCKIQIAETNAKCIQQQLDSYTECQRKEAECRETCKKMEPPTAGVSMTHPAADTHRRIPQANKKPPRPPSTPPPIDPKPARSRDNSHAIAGESTDEQATTLATALKRPSVVAACTAHGALPPTPPPPPTAGWTASAEHQLRHKHRLYTESPCGFV